MCIQSNQQPDGCARSSNCCTGAPTHPPHFFPSSREWHIACTNTHCCLPLSASLQWGSYPPVAFVRMERDENINARIARNQEVG